MAELKIERRLNYVDLILTRQILFWSAVVEMFRYGVTYKKARAGILQRKYNECLATGKDNLYYAKGDMKSGELGPQLKDTRIEKGGFPLWLAILLYLLAKREYNKYKKRRK